MSDTMQDVVDSDLELRDEEQRLIRSLRSKNISAGAVDDRIQQHMAKQAQPAQPAATPQPTGDAKTITVGEAKTMMTKLSETIAETASVESAKNTMKSYIGKRLDASGVTGAKPQRREAITEQVLEVLRAREDVGKMTDDQFSAAMNEEADKIILKEGTEIKEIAEKMPSQKTDESKGGGKTAAETMGERNSDEPPPKSAARTEQVPTSGNVSPGNMRFGENQDWSGHDDASMQAGTSRKAQDFLQNARGG